MSKKTVLLVGALALMGGAVSVMSFAKPRLGAPGVKTSPIAGSDIRVKVELPAQVLDYESEELPVSGITRGTLPEDTSFGTRNYHRAGGRDELGLNVVLMGMDRTSLHKPQFCLEGQGCHIDQARTLETKVQVERPCAYELPVTRLVATVEVNGQPTDRRLIYVYWYVADGVMSASELGGERLLLMAKNLFRTGVLQRWAYISCQCMCAAGEEEATFERMKRFIAAAAPEFQLYPSGAEVAKK